MVSSFKHVPLLFLLCFLGLIPMLNVFFSVFDLYQL